ncbi:p450 monooxygenase [Colletotrichum abscissum]|uniref:P450 monooxygenase n=1 Tax=Colletotrichum abscissum TaxID=1671311 RepID=A0A9P9X6G3_9PEZI|nr:p450 monooxygenase [Colletotrichum abscissum]KAI3539369.1 p450 monooxygenase [Colletotrichum abscissum]KAK1511692.1 p450 monooxygenase [Colletotrichum abscissum]
MIEDALLAALQQFFSPEGLGVVIALALSAILGRLTIFARKDENDISSLPLVNGKKWWQLTAKEQRKTFCNHAKEILDHALLNVGDKFRVQTENGVELLLSAEYASGMKDDEALDFGKHVEEDMHTSLDGFAPFRQGQTRDRIFHDAVKINLIQDIARLNTPLSEEASHALQKHFTNKAEWHEIPLKILAFKIVSQLSSRVYLGEELCRNDDWLQVTVDYTRDSMQAAQDLRLWPRFLRPLAYWYLPRCRAIRQELQTSFNIVDPVLQNRRREKEKRVKQGLEPVRHLDAMQWMEDAANGRPYDATVAQIMMAIAANFSGSDSLSTLMIYLCQDPQLVEDMRKEVITVLSENKWSKSTLYKLRLMDSVLKESQRMKPAAIAVMRRIALKDTKLHDGTKIPKGTKLMVSTSKSWDADKYPNPEKFDGYRFLRMREEQGLETAQFVSTTPDALGFGMGKHACPGRFFAANELKIALSHILLKYDFKLAPGAPTDPTFQALYWSANDNARIVIRRRKEEIEL